MRDLAPVWMLGSCPDRQKEKAPCLSADGHVADESGQTQRMVACEATARIGWWCLVGHCRTESKMLPFQASPAWKETSNVVAEKAEFPVGTMPNTIKASHCCEGAQSL